MTVKEFFETMQDSRNYYIELIDMGSNTELHTDVTDFFDEDQVDDMWKCADISSWQMNKEKDTFVLEVWR